jgi:quinolinate synthase
MTIKEITKRITDLKAEKNAVILAHYYQEEAIQNIADFVGDSYGLSVEASKTKADLIVFAGVHFMAETAKIINPTKKVVVPDPNASCSLAESCPPIKFRNFIKDFPDHTIVTYINCSAEIKAMSDIVCTSSNAVKVIESIPIDKPIIFAPDKNLGKYLQKITGRKFVLWDGACIVHEAFSFDKIVELKLKYPQAVIVAHPESEEHILSLAKYIGSTSGMIEYVKNSTKQTFIVATEAGILHRMKIEVPNKTLIPAPTVEENSCSCSECGFMRLNTLVKILDCLETESPEVKISPEILSKAMIPIEKMLNLSV